MSQRKFGHFNHPERKPGEVFITYFTRRAADMATYKTKRLGEPYDDGRGDKDAHGRPVGDDIVFPLFVSEEEARSKGIIPSQQAEW